jgi:paraquat-inducible protein B
MPETPPGPEVPGLPQAVPVATPRWKLQIIWLIPLVAALIGGALALRAIIGQGPTVTISFLNAEGLEAGKTRLKYKNVDIGLVKAVTLSKDLSRAVATAEVVKDFEPHLVEDTRFWVVRPRIAGGTITGLGTVLSGSYVGVDAGKSRQPRTAFIGLETAPIVTYDTPGHEYTIHADNVGSLDVGVPVFFRRIPVGQVAGLALDPDGKGVTVKVFINEPYTRYVNVNTRFWNAGGIRVKLDANGFKVDTQSLVSIAIGGIAFDNPDTDERAVPAPDNTGFKLFPDREEAMKNPETEVLNWVLVFNESVRGLAIGAPVEFEGINIGEITAIKLDLDTVTGKAKIPVEVNIYPQRLRSRSRKYLAALPPARRRAFIDAMVAQGLRAQLRTANLLTNQLYIALDFFPNAPKARVDWEAVPPEMPTTKGNLQQIQNALGAVAAKLDRIPLDKIGSDLRQTLETANALLQRLDREVAPEARDTLAEARKALRSVDRLVAPDQPLQHDARETMREVARAAQALRVLADYLERHPESLVRGKKEDER